MKAYPAIFREEMGGIWFVFFPDLGCMTYGETWDEAVKKAIGALLFWLSYEDSGEPSDLQKILPRVEGGDSLVYVSENGLVNIPGLEPPVQHIVAGEEYGI